jgi:hypothetical protein
MFRHFPAASLVALLAVAPVAGQEKRGKNRKSEEAAKWVESVGDHFFLTLSGPPHSYNLVFTTDKGYEKGDRNLKVYAITKEEAAAVVQTLVDSGLWGRGDTLAEFPAGPMLQIGKQYAGSQQGIWLLGAADDDISSLVIVQSSFSICSGLPRARASVNRR